MLLEDRHVRGAHIIRLQRFGPVKAYRTQRKSGINSLLRDLEMTETESMSAMLAYIYLLHSYPTTKATGLDTPTKIQENKQIRDGQRKKERGRICCCLFYSTCRLSHCYPVQRLLTSNLQWIRVMGNASWLSV